VIGKGIQHNQIRPANFNADNIIPNATELRLIVPEILYMDTFPFCVHFMHGIL
jgi:hypothetical protein